MRFLVSTRQDIPGGTAVVESQDVEPLSLIIPAALLKLPPYEIDKEWPNANLFQRGSWAVCYHAPCTR